MPTVGEVKQGKAGRWGRWDGTDWIIVSEEEALSATVNKQSPLNMDGLSYRTPQERRADREGDQAGMGLTRQNVVDSGKDILAGLGRASTSIMAGATDFVREGFGGHLPPNKPLLDAADTMRKAPNTFDAMIGADPTSTAYGVSELAGRALPYVAGATAAAPLRGGQMLFNAIRGNSGSAMSVIKYLLSRSAEAGVVDAATATVVGDDPLVAGAMGAAGYFIPAAKFDRGGIVEAANRGNVSNALDHTGIELGRSTFEQHPGGAVSREVKRGFEAQQSLASQFKAARRIDVGVARERGSKALLEVENVLRGDAAVATPFIQRELDNALGMETAFREFYGSTGSKSPRQLAQGVTTSAAEAKDAYIETYHGGWGHTADVLGLTQKAADAGMDGEALLRATEITPAGIAALEKTLVDIQEKYGKTTPQWQSVYGYIRETIDAASGKEVPTKLLDHNGNPFTTKQPGLTIENINNLSRHYFSKDVDAHIPTKGIKEDFRKGLNNAMAKTIEELGTTATGSAKQGSELASEWLGVRTEVAKALDKWEGDALTKLRNASNKVNARTLAKALAMNPDWTADVLSFIEGAGKSSDEAKRLIAKGTLINAMEGARSSPGAGGFSWDDAGFRAAIDKTRDVNKLVMDQDMANTLNEFSELSASLQLVGKPIEQQNVKAQLQNITAYSEAAIEQQAEGGIVGAVDAGARNGVSAMAIAAGRNQLNKYFANNAIGRITTNREALAEVLTDPSLRGPLINDMRSVVSNLRNGKAPKMNDNLQVLIKRRLAAINPDLYRRIYSVKTNAAGVEDAFTGMEPMTKPSPVGFGGAAAPLFGERNY